jgi:hypothetical protein
LHYCPVKIRKYSRSAAHHNRQSGQVNLLVFLWSEKSLYNQFPGGWGFFHLAAML